MPSWVYGHDAATKRPVDPLFLDTGSAADARLQAALAGIEVEEIEVIAPTLHTVSTTQHLNSSSAAPWFTRLFVTGMLIAAIALQAVSVTAIIFLPFGFDHPSSLGLDFDHLVIALGVYAAAFLTGLILSVAQRRWIFLAIQLIFAAVVLGSFLG